MPTYTYKCDKCQDEFDIYQRLEAKPLKKCKKCKGKLKKIIGIPILVYIRGRTVGSIADKNTTNYSDDCKNSISPSKKKKPVDTEYSKHISKLGKLNKEQANKYIETGKIP